MVHKNTHQNATKTPTKKPLWIGLKKVDSKKETIIMKLHTEFQKKYYQQVIVVD